MTETIHDQMKEKVELAFIYARDGAFSTAATIFRKVAQEYQSRSDEIGIRINMLSPPTPHERKVLEFFHGESSEHVYPFSHVSALTGLNSHQTKRAVRRLKRQGFVELVPCFNEDYGVAGCGWQLTGFGREYANKVFGS